MPTPRFTIAICTFNRSDVLPMAVRGAACLDAADGEFEIIVVDNASTDDTPRVLDELEREIPRLRRFVEPTKGLSPARNRALQEAQGSWIIYLDDDALVAGSYLQTLSRLIAEEQNIGAAGGIIEVGWLSPVPDWYEPGLDGHFNHLYIASYRMELKFPKAVYGTNMAFPVDVLRKVGGFSVDFGYAGTNNQLAGEDVEVQLRIVRDTGLRIIWEPELRIRHMIHPGRLTPEKMEIKAEWSGRALARLVRLYNATWLYKILNREAWGFRIRALLGQAPRDVVGRVRRAQLHGFTDEYRKWRP
jgi:glycosyltransferase involved in cell wall biosynthesis